MRARRASCPGSRSAGSVPRMAMALGLAESGKTLERRLTGHYQDAFLVARDPMSRTGFQGDSAGAVGLRRQLGRIGMTVTAERGEVAAGLRPGDRPAALRDRLAELRPPLRPGQAEPRREPARRAVDPARRPLLADHRSRRRHQLVRRRRAAIRPRPRLGRQAAYRRGWTSIPAGGGLAQGGRLATDAWSLDVAKPAPAARRPLRAAADAAAAGPLRRLRPQRPVSYSYDTLSAGYENRFFNLAPTGREIDLEAAYGFDLLAGAGHLSANAFARRDPGNVAAMDTDLGAAIRFTLGFNAGLPRESRSAPSGPGPGASSSGPSRTASARSCGSVRRRS
jgi:hypothetical protein